MSLPARGRVGDMGVGIACAKALRRDRAWYLVGIKEDRMAEGAAGLVRWAEARFEKAL